MQRAVHTTSLLGLMLRDMKSELCSRFIDELVLVDKNAKALGSPGITTRASLGPCIGEGNRTFSKYSLFGHIYLLLQVILEEVGKLITVQDARAHSDQLEQIITRTLIYTQLNCFPKEISATRLAITARTCCTKFREDYMISSFLNMIEWRCTKDFLQNHHALPHPLTIDDFRIFIDATKTYSPYLQYSMEENSALLSKHLRSILCLQNNEAQYQDFDEIQDLMDHDRLASNNDLIEYATQLDLPIFLSIDASLHNKSAISSVSLVVPDIQLHDVGLEWQQRRAKTVITRSWKLPTQWGTSPVDINMAEAVGLIIGDYMIPLDIPIIYITDSENVRTLQRNIKNKGLFTHQTLIRKIKQTIDHSIANHLEYITSRWPEEETLNEATLRMYKKGEEICKIWANLNKPAQNSRLPSYDQETSSLSKNCDDELDSIHIWEEHT